MNKFYLESFEINPFVRYVQSFKVLRSEYPSFFQSYDCRLFYIYKGSGILYINDESYRLTHGMLVIWHPGIKYRMKSDDNNTLILLGANFDFTQNHNDISYPIPPDNELQFDSKKILEKVTINDILVANDSIILSNTQSVEDMMLKMLHEFDAKKIFYPVIISSILKNILFYAFRKYTVSSDPKNKDDDKIDEILAYIQNHYMMNITNQSIGECFNYHPNYLNKLVLQSTGKSLYQYIINYRISKAIDLLSNTSLSVNAIAIETGFKDVHHFSKIFKQKTGMPPSKLRLL